MMLVKLEQGLGRLIRSNSDYGFITIFDSRIWNDNKTINFLKKNGYVLTDNIKRVQEFMNYNENHIMQTNQPLYSRDNLIIPVIHNKSNTIKTNFINTNKTKSDYPMPQSEEDAREYLQNWLRIFAKNIEIKQSTHLSKSDINLLEPTETVIKMRLIIAIEKIYP